MSDLLLYSIMATATKAPSALTAPVAPSGATPREVAPLLPVPLALSASSSSTTTPVTNAGATTSATTLPPIAALDNYCYTTRFYNSPQKELLHGLGLLLTMALRAPLVTPPLAALAALAPAPLVGLATRLSLALLALLLQTLLLMPLMPLTPNLRGPLPHHLPLMLPQLALMALPLSLAPRQRRQRLGPLCDSCRARKVKCDADVVIIAKLPADAGALAEFDLSPADHQAVLLGAAVAVGDDNSLVLSHGKLIKFKVCKLCHVKGLSCCFSKGFTKEDIMMNNKRRDDGVPAALALLVATVGAKKLRPAKIAKKRAPTSLVTIALLTLALMAADSVPLVLAPAPALVLPLTRKLLCFSCRKRKVKCAFNLAVLKCENCFKKGAECVFDCKPAKADA